jgi:hypothetical protein
LISSSFGVTPVLNVSQRGLPRRDGKDRVKPARDQDVMVCTLDAVSGFKAADCVASTDAFGSPVVRLRRDPSAMLGFLFQAPPVKMPTIVQLPFRFAVLLSGCLTLALSLVPSKTRAKPNVVQLENAEPGTAD